MIGHWFIPLFGGVSPAPQVNLNGAGWNLRAQFKGVETEEQKQLRREAQGIIQRIKETPKPTQEQVVEFYDDAEEVSQKLQDAITAILNRQQVYLSQLEEQARLEAEAQQRQQARDLELLLIEAQLQASILQQQIDELDAVFVMFVMAAHA